MILDELAIDPRTFEARTGWTSTPGGLCKGDVCVPAPESVRSDGRLDLAVVAERLDMALVHDAESGSHALGPEALGRSLTTATAPELELHNMTDGNMFRLSALHGRKVLLVAWASW